MKHLSFLQMTLFSGIEIFDTCGSTAVSQRAAMAALSGSDCDGHYTLGQFVTF